METTKIRIIMGILVSLGVFSLAHGSSRKEFKKKWTQCRVDADCVVLKRPCQFLCVNRNSVKEVQDFYTLSGNTFPCKEPEIWKKPVATCREQTCSCDNAMPTEDPNLKKMKDDKTPKT